MNFKIVILAVLGLTGTCFVSSLPTNELPGLSRGLKQDLQDFLQLIPTEKIKDLFYEYLNNDEEFGEALDYIMSAEFTQFVVEIEAMPELRRGLDYLQKSGLDAYGFVNKINKYLGIPEIKPELRFRAIMPITGGLSGFIKDVKALIPWKKLEALYEEKLETSKDFAGLINKLSSPEFQTLVDKLMAKPKMQEVLNILKKKGVNVQEILDLLTGMLGLKFPKPQGKLYRTLELTRSLQDDLNDFVKLVPTERIKDLFYEYLNNDEEFGEALDYVMSEEFAEFVVEIEAMPELRKGLDYLQEAGLDAYGFVNKINKYLGIPEIAPKFRAIMPITGGLSGFIKDVKALVPWEKLEALYQEKIKTSKDFAGLINKLSSPEFQTLVDKLMAKPKMQEVLNILKKKGVNVQEILDLLTGMLGLKFPKPF